MMFAVTHKITPYNELRLYVEAPRGTHANTMAKAARDYIATLPSPEYVEWNGTKRPGQWCRHLGESAAYYTTHAEKELVKRKLYWRTIVTPA